MPASGERVRIATIEPRDSRIDVDGPRLDRGVAIAIGVGVAVSIAGLIFFLIFALFRVGGPIGP